MKVTSTVETIGGGGAKTMLSARVIPVDSKSVDVFVVYVVTLTIGVVVELVMLVVALVVPFV